MVDICDGVVRVEVAAGGYATRRELKQECPRQRHCISFDCSTLA